MEVSHRRKLLPLLGGTAVFHDGAQSLQIHVPLPAPLRTGAPAAAGSEQQNRLAGGLMDLLVHLFPLNLAAVIQ